MLLNIRNWKREIPFFLTTLLGILSSNLLLSSSTFEVYNYLLILLLLFLVYPFRKKLFTKGKFLLFLVSAFITAYINLRLRIDFENFTKYRNILLGLTLLSFFLLVFLTFPKNRKFLQNCKLFLYRNARNLLFAIFLLIYLFSNSPNTSMDNFYYRFSPYSLLINKTLNMDKLYRLTESREITEPQKQYLAEIGTRYLVKDAKIPSQYFLLDYYVMLINEHIYTVFPLFPAFVHTSIFIVLKTLGFPLLLQEPVLNSPLARMTVEAAYTQIERVSAGLLASISCALMFSILKRIVSTKVSILLTIIYGLGTAHFAVSSQSFWQHGLIEFYLLLILRFLLRPYSFNITSTHSILGIIFAVCAFSRPMSTLFLFPLFIYYTIQNLKNRKLFYFLTTGVITGLFLLFLNYSIYGHILGGYGLFHLQVAETIRKTDLNYWESFFLFLFSPARGIFIFSPFLLFAFLPFFLQPKERWKIASFTAGIIFYILFFPSTNVWHGGTSFGGRMHTDILPLFMILIAFASKWILQNRTSSFILFFSSIFSILVYISGVSMGTNKWDSCNHQDVKHRFSEWKNPQFLDWFQENTLLFSEHREIPATSLCTTNGRLYEKIGSIVFKNPFPENVLQSEINLLLQGYDFMVSDNFYLPKGKYCYTLFSNETIQNLSELKVQSSQVALERPVELKNPIQLDIDTNRSRQFTVVWKGKFQGTFEIEKAKVQKGNCTHAN